MQGIKLGRPKGTEKSKLDKFKPEVEALLVNGSTQKFIPTILDYVKDSDGSDVEGLLADALK